MKNIITWHKLAKYLILRNHNYKWFNLRVVVFVLKTFHIFIYSSQIIIGISWRNVFRNYIG